MSSLDDGLLWLKNKMNKITQPVITEGFEGILGSAPSVDAMNLNDHHNTTNLTTDYNRDVMNYRNANQALIAKTNTYLNTVRGTQSRNYNIFVNSALGPDDITATTDPSQCAKILDPTSNHTYGLTDAGSAFYNAYPNNFLNQTDAQNACKLWAADSGVTYFGISKNVDNTTYKCSTGTLSGTPSQYSAPIVAYTIAESMDATLGGLFHDGTVGVYNGTEGATNINQPSNPKNVQLMQSSNSGGTVPSGYSMCDKWIGGAINTTTVQATLGANCSGLSKPPFNARYITIKGKGDLLQISQIAVYVYNTTTGAIQNVSPFGIASNGWLDKRSWQQSTPVHKAINGQLRNKSYPDIYHSSTSNSNEYWQLDLRQEYPVFKVVYWNRADCCQDRANGTTIILENANLTKQIVKQLSGDMIQTFFIENENSTANTGIAKHFPVMSAITGYTFNGNNDSPWNGQPPNDLLHGSVPTANDNITAPTAAANACNANSQCRGFNLIINPATGYPTGEIWLKGSMANLSRSNSSPNIVSYSRT